MKNKRLIKNISMILVIVIALTSLVFTIYYKNKQTTSTTNQIGVGNAPPDMNSQNGGGPNGGEQNSGTPPEKPDESNSNSQNNSETDSSNGDSSSKNTPPEKPDGDNNNQSSNGQNNDMPGGTPGGNNSDGNASSNMMPQQSNSQTNIFYYILFGIEGLIISLTLTYLIMSKFNKKTFKETFENSDKTIIYILLSILLTSVFTLGSSAINTNKNETNNNQQTQIGGNQGTNVSYSAKKEVTSDETLEDETYESTTKDENALSVSNAGVTAKGITVNKTGDSDGGDNTSFYGTNSAVIAKDGANLIIEDATITTNATGANGVFSYGGTASTKSSSGDGTTVTIKNSKITTEKDNSGGIMTTGGGITKAYNLTINTKGTSSAAIRTDRGGGTVEVEKGEYKTTGQGSPTVYSTADVTVKDATLTSTSSEGIVIEGKNKVTLDNVKLTDTNNKLNGKSTTYKNIFLYQSMSGDAEDGKSEFASTNSTITTNKGDTFYITNTTAEITLENNKIINNDSTGYFLRAKKDSWGNSGSNGGDVTLTLKNQEAEGDIYIDEVSTLDMSLKDNSTYTGTINKDKTAKSIKLTLSKNSKIKLTGDSYVTELNDSDTSYSNIDFNGYKLYVNGKVIN